ncbi:polysaccharide biosynthesis tyrosine autokinase [Subtercola endophyticus]|uniref:polysaccharide biosynthesis tyrosine autokinase n=1 Tax=Subtercola endophyticus TaxID=2895559 RepID=UPI001E58C216|nr:polysaccharide biosynthesis tyrosine autokinase [Subtercola endophyticus]UFS60438.1 polysaccharide biosynthesis tyrosine autokinase [Subtercola endophyticus]
MTLQDYVRVLKAHWAALLVFTLVGALTAWGWTFLQTPVYSANSTGIVSMVSDGTIGESVATDALAKSKATTFVAVGQSRAVADIVIGQLGLTDSAESVADRVTVTNTKDTPTINISARASSGVRAKQLADAWIVGMAAQIQTIESKTVTAGSTTVTAEPATFLEPIEAAVAPQSPIFPNTRISVLIGALLGLMVALVYAVVRNVLDRRIRSAAIIQQHFRLSVVGTLPRDKALSDLSRLTSGDGTVAGSVATAQSRALGEAFRELRTNLRFMHIDDPPRVIVVTSPSPNDGKSTVTANLAIALAAAGQKVVVVDGDLRKPMVASSFGVVGGVGVTDLLIGSAEVQDVLQPWGDSGNLNVLGAGSIPPNPSELLGTKGMNLLLRHLAEDAIVLVDAPPLLPVTDAAILAAQADGALVVVSAGRTTIDELERAVAGITLTNGKVLGIILNRVPHTGADGRSYGYYHGGYTSAAAAAAVPVPAPAVRPAARAV